MISSSDTSAMFSSRFSGTVSYGRTTTLASSDASRMVATAVHCSIGSTTCALSAISTLRSDTTDSQV